MNVAEAAPEDTPRKKPGRRRIASPDERPSGTETPNRSIRLGENLEQRMNRWRVAKWQANPAGGIPTESDTIRMLIDLGLKSEGI